MEHILELPKATCLLLSLAKNAGLSANSSSELTYKGKEFLLDAYQIALKNKTLQINIQKNKITFPMEEPDSGFHAVGVLTRSPAWEYGWKFNYLTENTSGAEKSEVKEKIPPKPLTALEHLERCGYRIVQQVVPKKLPPIAVQRMAWKTGEALCDPVVWISCSLFGHICRVTALFRFVSQRYFQEFVCHTFGNRSDVG